MPERSMLEQTREELTRLLRKVEVLGARVRQQQSIIDRLRRATSLRRNSRRDRPER
jgi:hypothetical protein